MYAVGEGARYAEQGERACRRPLHPAAQGHVGAGALHAHLQRCRCGAQVVGEPRLEEALVDPRAALAHEAAHARVQPRQRRRARIEFGHEERRYDVECDCVAGHHRVSSVGGVYHQETLVAAWVGLHQHIAACADRLVVEGGAAYRAACYVGREIAAKRWTYLCRARGHREQRDHKQQQKRLSHHNTWSVDIV